MQYAIVECSPKAKEKINSYEDTKGIEALPTHQRAKYPWQAMKIGQAFAVPLAEGNEASLRNGASLYAKNSGKKFTVIRHGELGCFEVARIA